MAQDDRSNPVVSQTDENPAGGKGEATQLAEAPRVDDVTRLDNASPRNDETLLDDATRLDEATQLDAAAAPVKPSVPVDDVPGHLDSATAIRKRPVVPTGAARRLRPGDTVDGGRFILEEELGRGGMSVVYRAIDLIKERAGDPNPHVALKLLNGDFSRHPDAWIALQQEISKTQSLAHPRIVTVHDFEIDGDLGLPFAIMEEMRGEPLQSLIDRHPDGLGDPERVARIVESIAEGLAYAHTRGIVHADMKPSNVFITEDDEIKILDFGIARFMPGAQHNARRPSNEVFGEHGINALTPFYASPEAFAGESPHPSDDLFALGIIAAILATGQHPFASVLDQPQPSVAAAEQGIVPRRIAGLRSGQWKAIAACLSYERSKRPADGSDFLTRFRPLNKWLKALSALSIVLAISVVVVLMRAEQRRPDIPFDELPIATQQQITEALEQGNVALRMGDVNGALFYFADAFELHPFNARASEGLESALERVLDQAPPSTAAERRRRIEQLEALGEYPLLSESRARQRAIDRLRSMSLP